MGRSRGGLTTKIHALVDAEGLPIDLRLSEGQHADCRHAEDLLTRLHAGATLLADRGYDTDAIRATANQAKAFANIPVKRNRKKPSLSVRSSIAIETSSSGSSTASKKRVELQRVTTTILQQSSSSPCEYG